MRRFKQIAAVAFNAFFFAVMLFVPAGTVRWLRAWILIRSTRLRRGHGHVFQAVVQVHATTICAGWRARRPTKVGRLVSPIIGLSESEILLGAARAGHVECVVEGSLQHSAEAFLRQMVHAS